MAICFLSNSQCRKGGTPDICCVCGESPTVPTLNRFRVHSHSSGRTDYFHVREAWVPLCSIHGTYFKKTLWIVLGSFALLVTAAIVMFGAGVIAATFLHSRVAIFPPCCAMFSIVVLFACFVVFAFYFSNSRVRLAELSDDGIKLTNVHEDFAKAVAKQQEKEDDDDDEDDDEDDEPKARR